MSDTLLRVNLRVANNTLLDAMSATDPELARMLAFQAANRIIDALQQTIAKPSDEPRYCANLACRRQITDQDPAMRGFCSTMCREGFDARLILAKRGTRPPQFDRGEMA